MSEIPSRFSCIDRRRIVEKLCNSLSGARITGFFESIMEFITNSRGPNHRGWEIKPGSVILNCGWD